MRQQKSDFIDLDISILDEMMKDEMMKIYTLVKTISIV